LKNNSNFNLEAKKHELQYFFCFKPKTQKFFIKNTFYLVSKKNIKINININIVGVIIIIKLSTAYI